MKIFFSRSSAGIACPLGHALERIVGTDSGFYFNEVDRSVGRIPSSSSFPVTRVNRGIVEELRASINDYKTKLDDSPIKSGIDGMIDLEGEVLDGERKEDLPIPGNESSYALIPLVVGPEEDGERQLWERRKDSFCQICETNHLTGGIYIQTSLNINGVSVYKYI